MSKRLDTKPPCRQSFGHFELLVPDANDVLSSSYRIVGYASPVITMGQMHGWHLSNY